MSPGSHCTDNPSAPVDRLVQLLDGLRVFRFAQRERLFVGQIPIFPYGVDEIGKSILSIPEGSPVLYLDTTTA
jgi:hypothetical protein